MRYRVRPGFTHGAFGQFGPGDVVELSEAEAASFLDKLERLPDAPPLNPAAEEQPVPPPADTTTDDSKKRKD